MIETLKKRIAREESGFTLIELLVVIIILGILLAIAVPSYLGLKDRANRSAAKANVRALVPDIEQYNADNAGNASDVDASAATSGYQGMTAQLLHDNYDASIDTTAGVWNFSMLSPTDYCVYTASGKYTGYKHGPSGVIYATLSSDFQSSSCDSTGTTY